MEEKFLSLLESLRVKQSYVKLFREVVLDVWHGRLKEAKQQVEAQRREVQRLKAKEDKLLDVLIEGTISEETYKDKLAKLKTDAVLTRIDERAWEGDKFDIEAVLDFAEQILTSPAKMWKCANLKQRQQLQSLLFPEGLVWDGEAFANVVTCFVVKHLRQDEVSKLSLVTLTGFEPVLLG